MPAVEIVVPTFPGDPTSPPVGFEKHLRAVLRQVEATRLPNGLVFQLSVNLNFAPVTVRHQQLAAVYAQVDRPGRQPLSVWANPQLEQISFQAVIVSDENPGLASCEEKLNLLRSMASLPTDVVLAYAKESNGKRWKFSDFSYESAMRDPRTDEIVRANADITLTESVLVAQVVPGLQAIKDVPLRNGTSGAQRAAPQRDDWDQWSLENSNLGTTRTAPAGSTTTTTTALSE